MGRVSEERPTLADGCPARSSKPVNLDRPIGPEEALLSTRYCLLNPPLADPTCPYHSLSYLVSAARSAGYREELVLDTNIEGLNYLAAPERVAALLEWCVGRIAELDERGPRTREEQLLYRACLPAIGMSANAVEGAIQALKTPSDFYNYHTYRCAAQVVRRWMGLLSASGLPAHYHGFKLNPMGAFNLSRIEDLTDVSLRGRLTAPFTSYFEGPLCETLEEFGPDLVGITVPFQHQLPFALAIGRVVRERLPGIRLCIGGTEVWDVYKFLSDKSRLWEIFEDFDWVALGEGEATFVTLLDWVAKGELPPPGTPGLLGQEEVRSSKTRSLPIQQAQAHVPTQYHDVGAHAGPAYDFWNWDAYWSPENVALYSPTRGCYWNKCTFCDYGLNTDSPTSPSRERPVDRVVSDLDSIKDIAQVFHFAVDAMSPRYLVALAAALDESDVSISWAAELRLERAFGKKLAHVVRSSGCVAISFGFESANQRVLGLIDKGVRIGEVPGMLEQLKAAGIGAQMMGFIGFPTETRAEALETFAFLEEHADDWATAIIGDFAMTGGAIVARTSEGFGTKEVGPLEGEDINRILYWREADGRIRYLGDQRNDQIDAARLSITRHPLGRPFVGGVDNAHSILYFRRFGRRLVPPREEHREDPPWYPSIVEHRTPFGSIERFARESDLKECVTQAWARGASWGHREAREWLAETAQKEAFGDESPEVLEILPSGTTVHATPDWRERDDLQRFFSHSPAALMREREEFTDREYV